jgi:AcrR family transcriptional regulator
MMSAALAIFSEHGFRGATMDRIAEAAGVTKGTIYLYFPNKEALFIETLRVHTEGLLELLPEFEIRAGEDIEEVAGVLAQALMSLLLQPAMAKVFPLFVAEVKHLPALKRLYLEEWLPRTNLYLAEVLRQGMAAGIFRALDPVIAARSLLGMFGTFVLTQEVFEAKAVTPMKADAIAATIIAIFFRGVLAAP